MHGTQSTPVHSSSGPHSAWTLCQLLLAILLQLGFQMSQNLSHEPRTTYAAAAIADDRRCSLDPSLPAGHAHALLAPSRMTVTAARLQRTRQAQRVTKTRAPRARQLQSTALDHLGNRCRRRRRRRRHVRDDDDAVCTCRHQLHAMMHRHQQVVRGSTGPKAAVRPSVDRDRQQEARAPPITKTHACMRHCAWELAMQCARAICKPLSISLSKFLI